MNNEDLKEECLKKALKARRLSADPEPSPSENVRHDQHWQSWNYCARNQEKVNAALECAEAALAVPGNQFGTYAIRLKAMIEVYKEFATLQDDK